MQTVSIQQGLTFTHTFPEDLPDDEFDAECEHFQELNEIAKKYAIGCRFEVVRAGATALIWAQKVTLDEIAMNTVFSDLLEELFILELRYAALGGAGCESALEVTRAWPRSSG